MPPFELNPERAQELLDSVPVTYLIFEDDFTEKYVSRVTQATRICGRKYTQIGDG